MNTPTQSTNSSVPTRPIAPVIGGSGHQSEAAAKARETVISALRSEYPDDESLDDGALIQKHSEFARELEASLKAYYVSLEGFHVDLNRLLSGE